LREFDPTLSVIHTTMRLRLKSVQKFETNLGQSILCCLFFI